MISLLVSVYCVLGTRENDSGLSSLPSANKVGVASPGLSPASDEVEEMTADNEEWSPHHSVRIKLPYNRNARYDASSGGGGRGKRRVRCMQCPACLRTDDCGKCDYCR